MIAVVSLLFRRHATFQLAMALLVVFVAYAFQVRNRPYMSKKEAQLVVEEYRRRVAAEKRMADARGEQYIQPAHLRLDKKAYSHVHLSTMDRDVGRVESVANFLWDYNTVESTLLFCACLILMSGIMFESGQLEDTEGTFTNVSAQILSLLTLLIIISSFVYFAMVLMAEIAVSLNPALFKQISKWSRAIHRDSSIDDEDEFDDGDMMTHMTANPLNQRQAEAKAQTLLERTRQQDAILALQNMQLRGLRRKKETQSRRSSSPRGLTSPRRSLIAESASKLSSKFSAKWIHHTESKKTIQREAPHRDSISKSKIDTSKNSGLPEGWIAAIDPDTNETYYANPSTGETSWDTPEE